MKKLSWAFSISNLGAIMSFYKSISVYESLLIYSLGEHVKVETKINLTFHDLQ